MLLGALDWALALHFVVMGAGEGDDLTTGTATALSGVCIGKGIGQHCRRVKSKQDEQTHKQTYRRSSLLRHVPLRPVLLCYVLLRHLL